MLSEKSENFHFYSIVQEVMIIIVFNNYNKSLL